MKLFKDFEQNYQKGFLLHNYYENIHKLKDKIDKNEIHLIQNKNNFFFYEKQKLYFFINQFDNFNLKPSYVGIFNKKENDLAKYDSFLKKNHFKIHQNFLQMSLKNENLQILFFDYIKQAEKKDCQECYDFFKVFFDTNYLFLVNPKNLENLNKNILVYKEQGVISGALFYTQSFQTAFLDFIAVKQGLKYKNIAFALLNHYFSINKENKFFKLFVEEKNEKAINFYKKAGFIFNGMNLKFHKNF